MLLSFQKKESIRHSLKISYFMFLKIESIENYFKNRSLDKLKLVFCKKKIATVNSMFFRFSLK